MQGSRQAGRQDTIARKPQSTGQQTCSAPGLASHNTVPLSLLRAAVRGETGDSVIEAALSNQKAAWRGGLRKADSMVLRRSRNRSPLAQGTPHLLHTRSLTGLDGIVYGMQVGVGCPLLSSTRPAASCTPPSTSHSPARLLITHLPWLPEAFILGIELR